MIPEIRGGTTCVCWPDSGPCWGAPCFLSGRGVRWLDLGPPKLPSPALQSRLRDPAVSPPAAGAVPGMAVPPDGRHALLQAVATGWPWDSRVGYFWGGSCELMITALSHSHLPRVLGSFLCIVSSACWHFKFM